MKQMRLRGLLTVALATGVAVIGFAGVAQAHVTVDPDQATQGGYTRVAFRVPTESDTASTTKLDVFLPTDQPVASVSTMPVPGWTVQVTTSKLATPLTDDDGNKVTEAVSQITWTASADGAVKPGQFQEFPVSLGPLPKTGQLVFKVLQTYSDGTVVRWIDPVVAGQAEPEHPAPVLSLAAAGAEGGAATPSGPAPVAGARAGSSSDAVPVTFGVIGAVLGLAGLVLGALALARARRVTVPAPDTAQPVASRSA
jgi:periplasmic copper chaperone A